MQEASREQDAEEYVAYIPLGTTWCWYENQDPSANILLGDDEHFLEGG